jgi:hypothetical protein
MQVLMALADNPVVVKETCRTLTLLAEHSAALADAVMENDVNAITRLLPSVDHQRQLSTLQLLAALAAASEAAASKLASDSGLLRSLEQLILLDAESAGQQAAEQMGRKEEQLAAAVRVAALKALGNLALCPDNQRKLLRRHELMQQLTQLAQSDQGPVKVCAAALRVLAILGENDLVRRAVGKPPLEGRGLRVLSLGALRQA